MTHKRKRANPRRKVRRIKRPKTPIVTYSDGGSRGNPGLSAAAFVVCNQDGKVVASGSRFLGDDLTNNVAEYCGVQDSLTAAARFTGTAVTVCSDSKLVVNQMTGKWRVKAPHLKRLYHQTVALLQPFENVIFKWVPRYTSKIMLADSLCNQELDHAQFDDIEYRSGCDRKQKGKS
jgi:probable phosphoglycerate mutase